MNHTYFLFAGEASGDLHGSRLMRAIRMNHMTSSLLGVGGPLMREEGLDCVLPMEHFQVMGFSDVLKNFFQLRRLFYQVLKIILQTNPDCVILIDYPSFNLRLGKELRKQGFKGKIVQYICPSVWAHGKKRIDTLANHFDLLLTIYPFENSYFSHTHLKVVYVGNPIAETIRTHIYQSDWMSSLHLPEAQDWIALFPGSRQSEIEKHLPLQLNIAQQMKQKHPHIRFAISCAQESLLPIITSLLAKSHLQLSQDIFVVPSRYRYELMQICSSALAKSGTVTLELAMHLVPTFVHYELTTLNYFIAKYIVRINLPYYCIVNILGNRTIFPEFIDKKPSVLDALQAFERLQFDPLQRKLIQKECKSIQDQLHKKNTHECAAQEILELLHA